MKFMMFLNDCVYSVDATIGTSNTLNAVCSIIKKWGAKKIVIISVVASQAGLNKLQEQHPDVSIFLAAVDSNLSPDDSGGMLIPGLGDAGDLAFGNKL